MVYLIVGYLVSGIIFGFITMYVASSKGYDGGFWWGFFLGIIGLLVVGFRPDINTAASETANYTPRYGASLSDSSASSTISNNNSSGTWICDCGASNPNSIDYCLSCRRDRSMVTYQPKIMCPYCGAQNKATNTECFACHNPLKEEIVTTKEEKVESTKQESTSNSIELIQQLSKLHEQGILTDEEFQAKKADILAKM